MTRVKICGTQQPDHALVASEAGADYIGIVFVPGRSRRVDIDLAKEIVSRIKALGSGAPKVVGLFADQSIEEVNQVVDSCGLDLVQLCGHESLDYCQQMRAKVIKVVHVPFFADSVRPEPLRQAQYRLVEGPSNVPGSTGSPRTGPAYTELVGELEQAIQAYTNAGHLVTLDRLVDGLQGGTGQSFDWTVAAQLSQQGHEFLLAGGLTPDNVALAVAEVHPWGLDVSSGVETDGIKDPDKIREFVKNARRAGG